MKGVVSGIDSGIIDNIIRKSLGCCVYRLVFVVDGVATTPRRSFKTPLKSRTTHHVAQ